jgi:hypothetical protein
MKIIKSIKKRYRDIINYFRNGKKILVLSDSHGEVFEYINDNNLLLPHLINVKMVGGATAYGLNNNKSKTNALKRYIDEVEKFNCYNIILIQLGEIDCSFLLWKKLETSSLSMEELLDKSINGYRRLILKLKEMDKNIIITGAVLPTIKDNQKNPDNISIRNSINTTQLERTILTYEFNNRLKQLAFKNNIKYIDISNDCINETTKVIDDKYIRKQIDNHHSIENTSFLWVKKLYKILEEDNL